MDHCLEMQHKGIVLRPLKRCDIESLRIWRNNPDNSRYIRKMPFISEEDQKAWFDRYLQDEDSYCFAICDGETLVGSVSLYDISESSAEFGRLMIGEKKGCGYGSRATEAALRIAFEKLGVEKVRAEVSFGNQAALTIYTKVGFRITGERFNEEAQLDEYTIELDIRDFSVDTPNAQHPARQINSPLQTA